MIQTLMEICFQRDTSYEDSKHNEKYSNKEKDPFLVQTTHKIEAEDLQKKETREKMARRRALARKKAKIQSNRAGQVTSNEKSPEKSASRTKLKAVEIQTENYLHASLVKPPIIDIYTQTELELLDDFGPSRALRESHDEETQIIPGDLYDFEEDIQGALDILVGKTIESALIEILEEEELAALKEQQRRFFEIRAEEQREAGDLMERHLIERMTAKNNTGASILLEKYLIQLIPSVIDQLRSTGVISEEEYFKNGSFLPWLIEEVTMELVDILSSGDVLLDMVRDIVNRKTEISKAMDISEEHELRSEIEKLVDRE
ncbi:hypothetical protein WA026_008194 [Henosepilachna vigintioctopunctata]|uniref:Uncharacterized protein n=1 Tax=Henosepilachna vigintioctopunctata TaxID=420089 RepID=A0AAW1TRE5_9CUCU